MLEPSEKGLIILASNEEALAPPRDVIRQIHDADVEISEPRVRFRYCEAIQEPIMWVRAQSECTFTEAVLHELITREAQIEQVEGLAALPVVRTRAPLRRLLRCSNALAPLSRDTAKLRTWFSHYAPLPPDPGKAV